MTYPLRRVHFCTEMVCFCTVAEYLQFISLKLTGLQHELPQKPSRLEFTIIVQAWFY